ncbi:MAG: RdgB/HAM1 family non-canonical purine NTP pyrophosphatase [Chloroflexota bacterium]|nr:RdgB/HAM1 family non-canonical purine NTP pyrophosphatase [Dehalococcoidia bacterium]MDW8252812.1 RdgB/HAM1 family non-canonical purine NTP pyrophosphatase [Chloroflexota bacterium]
MTELLLIASTNPGKLRELRQALADLPYRLVTPADLGIRASVEEIGTTFEENAILKATAYAAMGECLALADDSGLEVDALGGAPGVESARFGGPGLDDAGRVRLLLEQLADLPPERRSARFVALIAIADPTGSVVTFRGVCEGIITTMPRGTGGFGYDPIFQPRGETRTMAELTLEEKQRLSHRGQAIAAARAWLSERAKVGV